MSHTRRPGRPPADPAFGAMPGAMRQRWYHKRQERVQRRIQHGGAAVGLVGTAAGGMAEKQEVRERRRAGRKPGRLTATSSRVWHVPLERQPGAWTRTGPRSIEHADLTNIVGSGRHPRCEKGGSAVGVAAKQISSPYREGRKDGSSAFWPRRPPPLSVK